MPDRDTVGKISLDLSKKTPDSRDPIELEREMHKDYEKNVFLAIERGKKEFGSLFYIVVITKKEPLMKNVLRNYFTPRSSCPTPDYDQALYKYDNDTLTFLWVVPSKDTCELFRDNLLQIDPSEKELLQFVLRFYDGDLLRLSRKLNGEIEEGIILEGRI